MQRTVERVYYFCHQSGIVYEDVYVLLTTTQHWNSWKSWILCPSTKFKSSSCDSTKGVLEPVVYLTCTSVNAPLMLKGACRFWSYICRQLDDVYYRVVPAYFRKKKKMLRHTLLVLQQCCFVEKEFGY